MQQLFWALNWGDLVTARMVIILRSLRAQKISQLEEESDNPDDVDESGADRVT